MPTDFRIQGFSAALLCKHCVLWPWNALPLCEPSFLCALMLKSINGILWRLNTQDSRSMSGRHRSSPAATTRSWSTWSLWSCGVVSKMLAWLEALKIDGIRRLHGYPTVSCLVTSGHWPKFQVTINFQGSSELLLVCDMDVGTVTAHQYLSVKFAHIYIYMSIYIYKYIHAFIPIFILWTYMWLIDCVVATHAIIDMYPYINLHHSFINLHHSFIPSFLPSFLYSFLPSFPPPFIHSFFHILSFIKYAFREESNRAIAALLDSLDSISLAWDRRFKHLRGFPFKVAVLHDKHRHKKKQVGTMASSFSACFSWCWMPFLFGNWCRNVAEKKIRDTSHLHLHGMVMKYLLLHLEKLDLNTLRRVCHGIILNRNKRLR